MVFCDNKQLGERHGAVDSVEFEVGYSLLLILSNPHRLSGLAPAFRPNKTR